MVWWVVSDSCGLFSATFTVLLLLYAQCVMMSVVILPWYGWSYHVVVYTFFTTMALISHCKAQFSNPGAVPKPSERPGLESIGNDDLCKYCRMIRPVRAIHCRTCSRCVINLDHHCPWVNNCVAYFNQKYFILFLIYTAICCFYSGVMLVGRFISCTRVMRTCTVTGLGAGLCILNFIEALIFGLFVSIMLYDQLSAIFENSTKGNYSALQFVFGEPFRWSWFFPVALPRRMVLDFQQMIQPPLPKPKTVITGGPESLLEPPTQAPDQTQLTFKKKD